VLAALHNVWLAGCVTTGVGFTVTDAIIPGPGQPANDGVMVNVVVIGAVVVLTNVPAILPVPDAAIPVRLTVLSLVQV
jgi:hypothetical protein